MDREPVQDPTLDVFVNVGSSLMVQWSRLCFHCRGHRFDPWLGNQDPTYLLVQQKKKKKVFINVNNIIALCPHASTLRPSLSDLSHPCLSFHHTWNVFCLQVILALL